MSCQVLADRSYANHPTDSTLLLLLKHSYLTLSAQQTASSTMGLHAHSTKETSAVPSPILRSITNTRRLASYSPSPDFAYSVSLKCSFIE